MTRFRGRPLLVAGVTLLLLIVLLVGGRAAWRLAFGLAGPPPPPRQTDVSQIAPWMSLPYISRAYRVPEPELYQALGIEREGRRMRSLNEIATETGRSPDEIVEIVRETVSAWQEAHPRSSPGGPAPPKPEEPKPAGQRAPPAGLSL
jgi:hypothetical protein